MPAIYSDVRSQVAIILWTMIYSVGSLSEDSEKHVIIKTSLGKLMGEKFQIADGSEGVQFLGVPYAKPPIGKLRFSVSIFSFVFLDI